MAFTARDLVEAIRAHHAAPTAATRARLDRLAVRPLPVSSGNNNTLFAAELDGQPCCAKLYRVDDRQRGRREWTALAFLRQRGLDLVPGPIHFDDAEDPAVGVMELVPGVPLLEVPVDRSHLRAEAEALRACYGATRDAADYPFESLGSAAPIVGRVRATIALAAAEDPAFAGTVAPFVARWRDAGDGELLEAAPAPAFIQGDRNPANSLWHDGRMRLVDWEYAGRGDPIFELADNVESIRRRAVPDADWAWFVSLFDLDAAQRERFEAGRRTASLFWLLTLWDRTRTGRPVDHGPERQLARVRTVFGRPLA